MKSTLTKFFKKEKKEGTLSGSAQLEEIVEALQAIARADFSVRTYKKGKNEKLNAIGVGISMLAEELGAREKTMQEKNKFFEDTQKATLNILEDVDLERKKVETSLVKQKAILESIGDGMVVTDTEGFIIMINYSAKKMLGLNTEDVIGRSWYDVAPLVDKENILAKKDERPIRLAIKEGRPVSNSTYYYRRRDGDNFPTSITAAPFVQGGKNIGAIVLFRDYTKEKKIDEVKNEFLLLAAHQFRTPLSIVNWYSETLISGNLGPLTKRQKKYLNEINDSSRRMTSLFAALLQVSQIESGEIAREVSESLDIKTLTEFVLEGLADKIKENDIKIIKRYEEVTPSVVANKGFLELVLKNIIENAVIYSNKGDLVKINISYEKEESNQEERERSILFVVEDKGIGIPQKEQSKIFTKLFRGSNVKQKNTYGNGLGLYISLIVIEHYGGTITFDSKEGEGSIFFVRIPIKSVSNKEYIEEVYLKEGLLDKTKKEGG